MEKTDMNKHVVWHDSLIKGRQTKKLGHKSLMFWFTGLSGSGKSTIANALQAELFIQNIYFYLLDGNNLRYGINKNLQLEQ